MKGGDHGGCFRVKQMKARGRGRGEGERGKY